MNNMYVVNDMDAILKMFEKAKANGKKPGDNCQEEFAEMLKENPNAVTFIGETDKDIDMLAGEIRDSDPNIKVQNINEINRISERN